VAAYLLKKEVEKIRLKSYLDSKSTLFEVINNFRLYDRVCIVSALKRSYSELHCNSSGFLCKVPVCVVLLFWVMGFYTPFLLNIY
jgi:hypothetical protein